MSVQTRPLPNHARTPHLPPRSARIMLACFMLLAIAAAMLPSVFPPSMPAARVPMWCLLAVLSGCLAVLLTVRPTTPRAVVLGLGWLLVTTTVLQAFVVGDLTAMFSTWLVVPILALLAGQLPPEPRKALVAAHVIASACWVGIALTVAAMSVVAMTTGDIDTSRVTYELMAIFDLTLLPWANFATFLTGLALGLTTSWGLFRYYWVAVKLTIAVGILFVAFGFLHDALERAAAEAEHLAAVGGTTADLSAAAEVAFWGFGGAMLSLVAAVLLSLYKPGGKTRRGRRVLTGGRGGQPQIRATIVDTRPIAEGTVALTLAADGAATLPDWAPGAHIDLVLPSGLVRQYSLYGDPAETGTYRVAVLREPNGRGGSAEIHTLRAGTSIGIRGPRNNFPLVDADTYLFIAGGIGITPFLLMIDRLHRSGADWRLIYRGRSLPTMAFATALTKQYPGRVTLLPADTHPRPDLDDLLRNTPEGVAVYCCGPERLISAVESAMGAQATLHTERFAASNRATDRTNAPFEAELRRSGVVVPVPANRTLLSAIQDIDPTVDLSCEDGVCGSCATRVLAGLPDHRDDVLQAGERDRVDIIYPCVSRARGERIVLDV
ncbi:PDR/VanB family oxidoreductase [Nocardia suismassiliense]|uniref:PDR/VanB family oxidoreductase n=1 Tax=Nocardia suismassiliense TaxID=2077092 RepID=UPI001F1E1A18|nr:PDR/VanB family oxidoreductase [Nocardia suismassiliense]